VWGLSFVFERKEKKKKLYSTYLVTIIILLFIKNIFRTYLGVFFSNFTLQQKEPLLTLNY
jgi:hypothetical protein